MTISLSIIVVNYNSLQLILDCLQSVYQFNSSIPLEVIIVDNSSNNEDEQICCQKFPSLRWIRMPYNAGFARANNQGIRNAKGDVVLLLNPDTLFEDDSISQCYLRLIQSNHIGAAVQLLNEDKTPQITGSYFIKGGINHFLPLPVLGKVLKWLGTTLKVKKTNLPVAKGEVEVDWINGAFLMVKKDVIGKAGMLDEDFFLYAEEIEWCARLLRYGSFCVYGDLHAIHLQGETANATFGSDGKGYFNLSDKKGSQIMLSNFVRIRKQFGVGWFIIHLIVYLFEIPLFFLQASQQYLFSSNQKRLSQARGFAVNVLMIISNSITIIRNKPHFYKVL